MRTRPIYATIPCKADYLTLKKLRERGGLGIWSLESVKHDYRARRLVHFGLAVAAKHPGGGVRYVIAEAVCTL